MLYPIIRRVRRPLLPPESSRTITTPEAQTAAPVSPILDTPEPPPALPVAPLPPLIEEPKPQQETPITQTAPKRAKAAKDKSR